MVGKYVDLVDAYKSLNEALDHAGLQTDTRVEIDYIDAEEIEAQGVGLLSHLDAILVPGGFGDRGIQGKIEAVRYAREQGIPFLGICLGMHMALIEYARNVCHLEGAHSTEMQSDTPHPIIALITEWQTADGALEQRSEESDLGGTMRLGAQPCRLVAGTRRRLSITPTRSPSGTGIVMRWIATTSPGWKRRAWRWVAGRWMVSWWKSSSCRPPLVCSLSVPPGVQVPAPRGHPLFTSFIEAALAMAQQWVMPREWRASRCW